MPKYAIEFLSFFVLVMNIFPNLTILTFLLYLLKIPIAKPLIRNEINGIEPHDVSDVKKVMVLYYLIGRRHCSAVSRNMA